MATRVCGDSRVAGVDNQESGGNPALGVEGHGRCELPPTHTLRGKGLCADHWRQGLKARDRDAARFRSYSNQLRNYTR